MNALQLLVISFLVTHMLMMLVLYGTTPMICIAHTTGSGIVNEVVRSAMASAAARSAPTHTQAAATPPGTNVGSSSGGIGGAQGQAQQNSSGGLGGAQVPSAPVGDQLGLSLGSLAVGAAGSAGECRSVGE